MAKLRILCLHGYRQNESIFREKSGALRKLLKREAEFFFVNAPHLITGDPGNLERPLELQERAWFFSRPDQTYKGTDTTDTCIGLEESIHFLEEVFKEQGPFDGILAFSQGACLLSIITANKRPSPIAYRFLIFVSGFKSLLSGHSATYPPSIGVPSFHIFGETDAVIPQEMSQDLCQLYTNSIQYTHKGGHYVPASPDLRNSLRDFLRPFLD